MRKLILSLIVLCVTLLVARGQNLVPNPSLDTITTCALTNNGDIIRAQPWFSATPDTPDLYNACATTNFFKTPQSGVGYQMPHSGSGYAGIGTGSMNDTTDNRREYIECKLRDTLSAGKSYCVEFYVSLADSSIWGMDQIGLYFSSTMVLDMSTIDNLSYQPQVESPAGIPIIDEVNWVKISGTYTATGNETFITIGNFHPTSQTTSDSLGGSWHWAYYFIDDVSVIQIADCVAGNNAEICYKDSLQLGVTPDSNVVYSWSPSTGLDNPNVANPKASPFSTTIYTLTQTECNVVSSSTVTVTVDHDCNSASSIFIPTILKGSEQLFIQGLEPNSLLEIFDMRGRLVYSLQDYDNEFSVFALAKEDYVVRLTKPDGEIIRQKLCVVN